MLIRKRDAKKLKASFTINEDIIKIKKSNKSLNLLHAKNKSEEINQFEKQNIKEKANNLNISTISKRFNINRNSNRETAISSDKLNYKKIEKNQLSPFQKLSLSSRRSLLKNSNNEMSINKEEVKRKENITTNTVTSKKCSKTTNNLINIKDTIRKLSSENAQKNKSVSNLRNMYEEKKITLVNNMRYRKKLSTKLIIKKNIFLFLEKLVEKSITQLKRQEILEGNLPLTEKAIIQLNKEQKDKDPEKITTLLENLPGFRKFMNIMGISRKYILQAAEKLKHKKYINGEVIFREGDKSDNFYCILNGNIQLSKKKRIEKEFTPHINSSHPNFYNIQKEILLNPEFKFKETIEVDEPFLILNTGDVFGEYGLIEDNNRGATAKAITDTDLLVVDQSSFKSNFRSSIERVLTERKIFIVMNIPFFSLYTKDDFHKVYLKMVIKQQEKGRIIIEEGDTASSIYLILKGGVCRVSKKYENKEIHILTMLQGDLFGLDAAVYENYLEIKNSKEENRQVKVSNLSKYSYSVISDSDDTIVVQLNLMTSNLINEDLFKQLYEYHVCKNKIINEIYEKHINLKQNYKLTYIRDEFERKVKKKLLCKYLDKSSSKIEQMTKEFKIESKMEKINKPAVKLNYYDNKIKIKKTDNEEKRSKSKTYKNLRMINLFNSSNNQSIYINDIPTTRKSLYNKYNTLKINITKSDTINEGKNEKESDQSKVIFSKRKTSVITNKNFKQSETLHSFSVKNSKNEQNMRKSSKHSSFKSLKSVKYNDDSLLEKTIKLSNISNKSNFNVHVVKDNNLLMFQTENFNLPLISQMKKS